MRALRIVSRLGLLALTLNACSTLRIAVDYDKSVDFAKYRTYKWIENAPPPENALVMKRFRAVIEHRLVAKGFTKSDRPDLLIALQTHRALETVFRTDVERWGYGPGWWRGNIAFTRPEQIPVGTLVLDLVDARSNELVWRGVARRLIDPEASSEKRDRHAEETIDRLLENFPPR